MLVVGRPPYRTVGWNLERYVMLDGTIWDVAGPLVPSYAKFQQRVCSNWTAGHELLPQRCGAPPRNAFGSSFFEDFREASCQQKLVVCTSLHAAVFQEFADHRNSLSGLQLNPQSPRAAPRGFPEPIGP